MIDVYERAIDENGRFGIFFERTTKALPAPFGIGAEASGSVDLRGQASRGRLEDLLRVARTP